MDSGGPRESDLRHTATCLGLSDLGAQEVGGICVGMHRSPHEIGRLASVERLLAAPTSRVITLTTPRLGLHAVLRCVNVGVDPRCRNRAGLATRQNSNKGRRYWRRSLSPALWRFREAAMITCLPDLPRAIFNFSPDSRTSGSLLAHATTTPLAGVSASRRSDKAFVAPGAS